MRRATAPGRTSAIVVAVGIVAVALTGCSSDPNTDCGTALPSGTASELVSATGKLGAEPTIDVPSPIDAPTSQRTILTKGTGEKVHQGQRVDITFTVINGETGKPVDALQQGSIALATDAASRALQCVPVGSRVAVALTPKDAGTGDDASAPTAIYIIDVLGASLSAANGAVRPAVSGFPTVVLAPTGQPGITIPSSAAPTKVRSEVLKAGDGGTVKKDSEVVLQYTAVGWDDKNVVTTSWQAGGPDRADMSTGASQLQNQQNSVLPQDMLGQLVGQKVGSQLVIETPENGSVPAAAWVVDILGVR